ncbi:Protein RER1 [Dictyocoela muelleri]|nr:Protein RER1 [Dictyocoela muelleri]
MNIIRVYLDKLIPLHRERWLIFAFTFIFFFARIIYISSHYLITYILSIYLLHALISFLTPKEDNIPDPFENFDDDVYIPQTIDDEFRPFMRRLPEYDFWSLCMKLVLLALFFTFLPFFDIPVNVPILVIYFIIMVILTARNMYRHMKKYQYNPFISNKEVYSVDKD